MKKPIFELIPDLFLAPHFCSHCCLFIRYSQPIIQLNFIRALTKEIYFPEWKLYFQIFTLTFTQILFFREPKLRFQHVKVIEIRSSVFNLLLQVKFQSLFLELKLRFQKWIFYSGQSFNFGNGASSLSCNKMLETKLWF